MAEPKTRDDHSRRRHDYTAGATGEQDVDASAADPEDTSTDHSERGWGGDQDIDTAGQVPGEMATDEVDETDSER